MNIQNSDRFNDEAEPEEVHFEDVVVERIQPRKMANLLLWLILGFFALFFAWAALAEVDRSVLSTGRVVPDSRLQIVSNLEGGIVDEIMVAAGEQVSRGQPLLRLDQTQRAAELGSSSSTVQSLQARIARLQGQLTGTEPRYAGDGSLASAEAIRIERALYSAEMADLASVIETGQARILQARRTITEAEANYQTALAQRRSFEQQRDLMRPLVDRGIEPRLTLVQLENQLAAAQSQASASQATISRAQASLAESQSAASQARQDWRARVAADLSQTQAQLSSLRQTLPALQDSIDRSTVTAPLDGTVNRVLVTTVGGSVGAGSPLVEIVPSGESVLIEARLAPKDIGFVRIGQAARISITAFPSNIYGSLEGELVTISPDATTDEETGGSYYIAQVRSKGALRDKAGRKLPIGVGMTADVSLLGEKRSVLSYLISPFTRLGQRALRE